MNNFETIEYELEQNPQAEDERTIGVITLDRPQRANALSHQMIVDLEVVLNRIEYEEPRPKVLVLTGKGDDSFCGGGDLITEGEILLSEMETDSGLQGDLKGFAESLFNDEYHVKSQQVLKKFEKLDQPTICAVNGWAVGGGIELVAASDLAVASNNARFSEIASSIGFIPEMGGAWHLPKVVGIRTAMELLLTGRTVDADEALEIGLVNRLTSQDQLMEEAKQLAGTIASRPFHSIAITKKLVRKYLNEGHREAAREDELQQVIDLTKTRTTQKAIRDFLDKKNPLQQNSPQD